MKRILVALTVLAGAAPSSAGPCFDYSLPTHPTRVFVASQAWSAVAASETHVFQLGLGTQFYVFEIDGPETPVGTATLDGTYREIAYAGDFVYISSATTNKVSVVDVSDPTAPFQRGILTGVGGRLDVEGSLLAVARGSGGLALVNVADPDVPFLTGSVTSIPVVDVSLEGNLAYLATNLQFRVMDVSDPTTPLEIGHIDMNEGTFAVHARGTEFWGTTGYIGPLDQYGTLRHFSAVNPANPTFLANVAPLLLLDMVEAGNFLAGPTVHKGLATIDISIPQTSTFVSHVPGFSSTQRIAGNAGGRVWLGNLPTSGALIEGQLSAIVSPSPVSTPTADGTGSRMASSGGLLFAVMYGGSFDDSGALRVFDPGSLSQIGSFVEGTDYVDGLLVDDGMALYTHGYADPSNDYFYLRALDVSNPATPTEIPIGSPFVGLYQLAGAALDTPYLYAPWSGGFRTVEIDPSGTITEHALLPVPGAFVSRATGTGLLVTGDTSAIHFIDVSDPDAPGELSSLPVPSSVRGLLVEGTTAYVTFLGASSRTDLFVIDFTNPGSPIVIGQTTAPHTTNGLTLANGMLYAYGDRAFCVIDVSNPAAPVYVGSGGATNIQLANVVAIDEKLIALETIPSPDPPYAAGEYRLRAFALQCFNSVSAPELPGAIVSATPAFPNPFRAGTNLQFLLPRASQVSLDVLDATGRRVRSVRNGTLPGGSHQLTWDGRDASGHETAAGVYFLRLRAGSEESVRRVVRLR
ncbi:MAG: T9SS type A sorting domain-containing protein [Gemmatimonadetes bacterium]|nr:T9SS type A sorting domain-containing protein [Gemmatimonadota bacterium]